MCRESFKKWLGGKEKVGVWTIAPESLLFEPDVLGCYFNVEKGKWSVYLSELKDKKVMTVHYVETENEAEAYTCLKSLIEFEQQSETFSA